MGRQSELIKKLRGGLTQQEFAKTVNSTQKDISRYEREIHDIPLLKFIEWCEKMGWEVVVEKK